MAFQWNVVCTISLAACASESQQADGVLHQLRREVEIHVRCKHPNIINLYCYFQDRERVYLIMELANSGTVLDKLQSMPERRFSEPQSAHYFVQALRCVKAGVFLSRPGSI